MKRKHADHADASRLATDRAPANDLPSLELRAIRELAHHPRWVLWRYEFRNGKQTKPAIRPDGRPASTSDPRTWSAFEEVAQAFANGVGCGLGFVFNGEGIVGVDLDDCIGPDGVLAPWAAAIVAQLYSYTEVSPSGSGLHLILRGKLPPGGRKRGGIEVYDRARFFTMTGRHWPGTPQTIEERSEALAAVPLDTLGAFVDERRGVAWRAFSKHHGRDDSDTLVIRAPSLLMNPTLAPEVVEAARSEDPQAAAAEWDAEWRSDVEALFDAEVVTRAVISGRVELPPVSSVRYLAFVDPSGGSSDPFTLCIAHRERETCVTDVLRERRPPFNPDSVTREFAELCRAYRVSKVIGDRYAGAWVTERFQAHRLRYEPSPLAKSDLYSALLGHVNSQRVELPDHTKLVSQLCALERRTARGTGRDSIDHPPGAHDDLANALAGAVHLVLAKPKREIEILDFNELFTFRPTVPDPDEPQVFQGMTYPFLK